MNRMIFNTVLIKPATRLPATLLLLVAIATTCFSTTLPAATSAPERPFSVERQWGLGGKGGWSFMCLDEPAHRLYIPRTNRVMVVDTVTGKVAGEVEGLINVRAVALDDSGKYGYATDPTDGSAGFVRVFDRSTLKLVTSIPSGQVPYTVVFDSVTKLVFAFNSRGRSTTIIDSRTNQVIATVSLPGRPGNAAVDGEGSVFVTLPARGEIARIDAAAKTITATWPIGPCTGPAGLTIDVGHRQLFTACEDHKLIAISMDTGQVAAIGEIPPNSGDISFDSKRDMLFLADASGMLTIFHRDSPGRYTRLPAVKTQPGARIMTLNQQDGKAYLATSKFGQNTSAVSEELQFRPTPIPGSFSVIVVGR